MGEVDLRLVAQRRLEAHDRLFRRLRLDPTDVLLDLGVAAWVAGSLDLLEEAHRRQLGKLFQAGNNDRLVGVQLRGHRRPRLTANRLLVELPVQLTGLDPVVDRARPTPTFLARAVLLMPCSR